MKIIEGMQLQGSYSNGIQSWKFSGTVVEIHNDTTGRNFATASIELDKSFDNREHIIMTLDAHHNIADNRYFLASECKHNRLSSLARTIADNTCREINRRADKIEDPSMPYKCKFVLEEVIKALQEKV